MGTRSGPPEPGPMPPQRPIPTADCMSLRDYFAGQALAGLLASNRLLFSSNVAEQCYDFANVMLLGRDK